MVKTAYESFLATSFLLLLKILNYTYKSSRDSEYSKTNYMCFSIYNPKHYQVFVYSNRPKTILAPFNKRSC